jgi:hypothetical protein
MQLTPHFHLIEFIRSQFAARRGIDNTPPDRLLDAIRGTASMLERIRAFLSEQAGKDVPIRITSGYRCESLELAVSGRVYGDHMLGCAADWEADAFGSPFDICKLLAPQAVELSIGQLINEFPPNGWVHTSTLMPKKDINRVITITQAGATPGVVMA